MRCLIRTLAGPLAAVTGLLLAAPGATMPTETASPMDDRFAAVRAAIPQRLVERGIPSLAVAVAKDGVILWEEGFGWADRERRRPATAHTMYSLASISKPITATGVMELVEAGTLDLDRPANDYLGTGKLTGLAGEAAGATVRRVLSHTAGLPLHYQFYYDGGGTTPPSMDETIARYGILVFPPGELYHYSNLGYGVLDHLIARAAGQDYADFMRRRVFVPLGMTRTSVGIGPGLAPDAAARYDEEQRPLPFYDFDHRGASAVYASAHDLVRFGMFHLKTRLPEQGEILKDATIDQMQQVQTPGAPGSGYGLGWAIAASEFGYRLVAHAGGMPGVSTWLNLYPGVKLAVVVLTNKRDDAGSEIAREIVAALLPEYAAARRARPPRAAGDGAAPTPSFPPELQGSWKGTLRTWEQNLSFALDFQPDGDVHVRLDRQLVALLNQVSFGGGELNGRFAGKIPTPDAARHPHDIRLQLRLGDGKLRGQATAQSTDAPGFFALTAYVELEKVGAG